LDVQIVRCNASAGLPDIAHKEQIHDASEALLGAVFAQAGSYPAAASKSLAHSRGVNLSAHFPMAFQGLSMVRPAAFRRRL